METHQRKTEIDIIAHYKEACNKILWCFCHKHCYDYQNAANSWVDGNIGGIVCCAGKFYDMQDILTDLIEDAPVDVIERSSRAGAEWQAKQSPWISVEERLPDITSEDGSSEYVLIKYKDLIPIVAKYCTEEYHNCPAYRFDKKTYRSHWFTTTSEWVKIPITHWMPIPTFDQILESNKDVLQRMKEK